VPLVCAQPCGVVLDRLRRDPQRRYRPGMMRVVKLGKEYGEHLALLAGVVVLIVTRGWPGVAAVPVAVLLFVLDQRHVDDDVACSKCFHRKDDHAGSCQECLRQQVQGQLARDVPCSRFGRTVVARRARAQTAEQPS
jgi:hypothetical protein